jgi:hypothetical protein
MKLEATISRRCAAASRSLDLLVGINNCNSVAGRRTIVLEVERMRRGCGEGQRSYEDRERSFCMWPPLVSNCQFGHRNWEINRREILGG